MGRHLLAASLLVALAACGARTPRDPDGGGGGTDGGGGGVDAGRLDAGGGTDAGVDCASAEEGVACAPEGASCGGPCTDECSFCNVLRCEGGVWVRLEAHPLPCFDCGPEERCVQDDEYCQLAHSDVAGIPDSYACQPVPAECAGEATCECIGMHVTYDACSEESPGAVTIEHFGG